MAEVPRRMTDEEWKAAVARAQAAWAKHNYIWMLTGCFAAKGDADRAKRLEKLLIAGRKAAE